MGAVDTAATGSGTAAVSPWLTAGTTVLSGVGGGVSAVSETNRNKKMYKELVKGADVLQSKVDSSEQEQLAKLQEAYGPLLEGAPENIKDYYSKMTNLDLSQFNVTAPEDFQFDLEAETQKQLNPELDAIIGRATGAVQQSAANRGSLFSGAAGKAIGRSTADIQAKEWDTASQRAQTQQQQAYQRYTDKFNNLLKVTELNKGNVMDELDAQGKVVGMQKGTMEKKIGEESEIGQGADQSGLEILSDKIKNEAALKSQPGSFEAFVNGFLGGASKGIGIS
jgi:hypothetical protein